MKILVYLDDAEQPYSEIEAPAEFELDTTEMEDGQHKITLKTVDANSVQSTRTMYFEVQNGPQITVHGLNERDAITGKIKIGANAYGSSIGDEFDPTRMESPVPIPTWAWVLFLLTVAWAVGYLSLTLHTRTNPVAKTSVSQEQVATETAAAVDGGDESGANWKAAGEQVYGNNCSSCHQATGSGVPGVFPPLKGNSVVLDDDASQHILTILNGLSGKEIEGIAYASPMPGFSSGLSDEEIAAVVNHERTQWGNSGKLTTAEEVTKLR